MRPAIKHLKPADYREMPWKNGGGSTTEIARSPGGEGDFAWRVSMADLKSSGPFSVFTGIDRVIVPISGPAFRLSHGALGTQVVSPFTPYSFSGDWTTVAELTGPGRDYNVMVRRATGRAWVDVLSLPAGKAPTRTYPKGLLVATLICGTARLGVAGEAFALTPLDTLICSTPGVVELDATSPAVLILSAILS